MSKGFFADLPPLESYSLMVETDSYVDLPQDWFVVLTDVRNSTKAIDAGRYKAVNGVGAACIVAVQNALGDLEFPYIFGGDGATLAIPASGVEAVKNALCHTRSVAQKEFGLELRIVVIQAGELLKAGGQLKVAKLRISENQCLALVRGNGWTLAEAWMKEREGEFNLPVQAEADGDISGLECRWNPLPARKHEILALIVQARAGGEAGAQIYREILKEILEQDTRPVSLAQLRLFWPPSFLWHEAKLRARRGVGRFRYLLKGYVVSLIHCLVMVVRGKKNLTKPIPYLRELTENTDYLKFDEALRMIIDVSKEEKERLLSKLEAHYQKGEIFYGHHADQHFLMTCYVQGPHKHIHFVDAAGGGYTMASKQLKAQRKAAAGG